MHKTNNEQRSRFSKSSGRPTLVGTIIILVIIAVIVFAVGRPLTKITVIATVTDKVHITENEDEKTTSKYLIYTEDETFECSDEVIYLKFNPYDIYQHIHEGNT